MRINTTANVSILVKSATDVVIVPNEAVRLKGDNYGVYIKGGKEPVWKDITKGIANDISTVILTGLGPDQEVVIKGMEKTLERTRGSFLFGRRGGKKGSTKGKAKGARPSNGGKGGGRPSGSEGQGGKPAGNGKPGGSGGHGK